MGWTFGDEIRTRGATMNTDDDATRKRAELDAAEDELHAAWAAADAAWAISDAEYSAAMDAARAAWAAWHAKKTKLIQVQPLEFGLMIQWTRRG
jgi:hypothetical protein